MRQECFPLKFEFRVNAHPRPLARQALFREILASRLDDRLTEFVKRQWRHTGEYFFKNVRGSIVASDHWVSERRNDTGTSRLPIYFVGRGCRSKRG